MSLRAISPFVAIYACGLIAAQIHRLEQGITELSALDTYYLMTGTAWVICFLPAVLFIAVLELSLAAWPAIVELRAAAGNAGLGWRAYARALAPLVLLLSSFAGAILWFVSDRPDHTFFDFRLYTRPKYYVYWNVAALNLLLALVWLALVVLVRWRVISKRTLGKHLFIPILLFAASLVYWSLTIYPAIDPSLGGAAPKLAWVDMESSKSQPIVLLLSGEEGIYYHVLSEAPDISKMPRHEAYWWSLPKEDPLVEALLKNQVVFLPKSQLRKLVVAADDDTQRYDQIRRAER